MVTGYLKNVYWYINIATYSWINMHVLYLVDNLDYRVMYSQALPHIV